MCRKVIDESVQECGPQGKFYPFCSQRCKLIDLGQWLDGKYRIITELKPEDKKGENTGQLEAKGG